jgi:nucleoid-associated protein YgaU
MKLQKLTIKAYKERNRNYFDLIGTFEAMFNPETYSQKYAITYGKHQGLTSSGREVDYSRSEPRKLKFTLILDGTGVQDIGLRRLRKKPTVSQWVKEFLDLTFRMNGDIHEPNFLRVEWGGSERDQQILDCRLLEANVTYTSFNRDGSPLRAKLDITLISDDETKTRMAKENKSSPDLTHSRMVKSGDTLPLLTKEIYGSAHYYLRVAQANNLDDFRNLTPGQVIIFPPLEKVS